MEKKSVRLTIIYIGVILVGILVYAYGFQVTEIDLKVPQDEQRQKQVIRALRGLLRPDLFERDEESQSAFAYFLVPCSGSSPDQPEAIEGQPYIEISSACGEPREMITIEVFNFRPYSDGHVRWTPPGGNSRSLGRIRTDADGHFLSS